MLITPSEVEPITTVFAKTHLKEDLTDATNDAYIASLVTTARRYLEEFTGYNCMEQTWEKYLDGWPSDGVIFLHKTPVSVIEKVEYYASKEATEYKELDVANYEKDIISLPARVKINSAPKLDERLNAVKVTFKAGHASADNVDPIAKYAILLLVGSMYENRQDEVTGTITSKLGRNFEWLCEMIEIKSM
jgi:uncharacterized phiE125 gp8 family phage protein